MVAPGRYVFVALAGIIFASCGGGGSPTIVTAQPTPPPPLNLTGTWKGTAVEICADGQHRTFDLTMALAQAAGSSALTGTITTRYGTSQFLDTITVGSLKDQVIELETDSANSPSGYRFRGLVDATGAEMNGSIAAIGYPMCSTFSVRR